MNTAAFSTAIIGSVLVISAYIIVFGNETATSYTQSRFWVNIRQDTAASLVPLQLLAAFGFITFVIEACGVITPDAEPKQGVLTYTYALTICLAAFTLSSALWPFAARSYLDHRDTRILAGANVAANTSEKLAATLTATCLVIAAISAIVMTAGAFEGDMRPQAVIGVLFFANVVVLADGVGWNSKMLYSAFSS